ncbi:hypothetical protein DdX_06968 [Ditylenchus destructor]|uniref:Uncharacterized protein n=1 Tax=Ditylenchus destructor TaxID=166010 RepID=A0AAD4N4X0_9BILA|nr:hypothetical protein DdX_06968 [Ditylenchus destructor]
MASGNPENPGFGQVTDHASGLGSGRVIRQSLRLGELSRLVPVSQATFASTGIYGFRKSGKSWIWPGHRSRVGARIRACDTSIASSRRAESIGTGLAGNICEYRDLWLPEIRKILDLGRAFTDAIPCFRRKLSKCGSDWQWQIYAQTDRALRFFCAEKPHSSFPPKNKYWDKGSIDRNINENRQKLMNHRLCLATVLTNSSKAIAINSKKVIPTHTDCHIGKDLISGKDEARARDLLRCREECMKEKDSFVCRMKLWLSRQNLCAISRINENCGLSASEFYLQLQRAIFEPNFPIVCRTNNQTNGGLSKAILKTRTSYQVRKSSRRRHPTKFENYADIREIHSRIFSKPNITMETTSEVAMQGNKLPLFPSFSPEIENIWNGNGWDADTSFADGRPWTIPTAARHIGRLILENHPNTIKTSSRKGAQPAITNNQYAALSEKFYNLSTTTKNFNVNGSTVPIIEVLKRIFLLPQNVNPPALLLIPKNTKFVLNTGNTATNTQRQALPEISRLKTEYLNTAAPKPIENSRFFAVEHAPAKEEADQNIPRRLL